MACVAFNLLAMAALNSITATRARIETSIPRKHGPAIAGYESVQQLFSDNVHSLCLIYVQLNFQPFFVLMQALKKFFEHVLQVSK
jgi:hypothetical protein